MMNKKILFFDCDETLWSSQGKDYISSVQSKIKKIDNNTVLRVQDGKVFSLKNGILDILIYLKKQGNVIVGVVSDNEEKQTLLALKMFGILKYIEKEAINIRLWPGYCPKHKMIQEVLQKPQFKNIRLKYMYWFDDQNYEKEAESIGIHYTQQGFRLQG